MRYLWCQIFLKICINIYYWYQLYDVPFITKIQNQFFYVLLFLTDSFEQPKPGVSFVIYKFSIPFNNCWFFWSITFIKSLLWLNVIFLIKKKCFIRNHFFLNSCRVSNVASLKPSQLLVRMSSKLNIISTKVGPYQM